MSSVISYKLLLWVVLLGVGTDSQLFWCNAGGLVRRGSFIVSPGLSLLWFDLMILRPFTLVLPETECWEETPPEH